MADAKGPMFNPADDLKALAFFVVILWFVWLITGGPARYERAQKPFLKPPVTGVSEQNIWRDPYTGEQYGAIPKVRVEVSRKPSEVEPSKNEGAFGKPIVYLTKGPADLSGRSYLMIDYPSFNASPLKITGLAVRDILGRSDVVGRASGLPYQGGINEEADVTVPPGSVVYLIEGQSPIGVSFRLNKCAIGLAKYQAFYPPFTGLTPFEPDLTYNDCVEIYKDDPNFYLNDWRIYTGAMDRVWVEKGDVVRLMDSSGSTLASMFY